MVPRPDSRDGGGFCAVLIQNLQQAHRISDSQGVHAIGAQKGLDCSGSCKPAEDLVPALRTVVVPGRPAALMPQRWWLLIRLSVTPGLRRRAPSLRTYPCVSQAALSKQGLPQTGATLISAAVIHPNCTTAPNYTATQTGKPCPKPAAHTGRSKSYYVQLGCAATLRALTLCMRPSQMLRMSATSLCAGLAAPISTRHGSGDRCCAAASSSTGCSCAESLIV